MIELFLCDGRRQKRSIVGLCEHFGDRHIRTKRANQNDFNLRTCQINNPNAKTIEKLSAIGIDIQTP